MPRTSSDTRQTLIAALSRNRGELDPAQLAALLQRLAAEAARDTTAKAA
jgi:hypothetical protein